MKDFLKQISIYGVLPVIGKFAGFLLIPIYTRLFSSAEFGMLELFMTLVKFLLFACNLEFYNAIGRFFYERNGVKNQKKLISTGLMLTVFSTVVITTVVFNFREQIFTEYLNTNEYWYEFRLCLVWLFFEAIFTYLSVIPRYEKKAKLYVSISVTALFVRISSTIFYVLYLNLGIAGVIYGHITGAIISLILNAFVSRKYLSFNFSWWDSKEIMRYAFPIVPGLLLIGFWGPLSRNLISEYFSLETLGLFAFAIRIAAIMEILNAAIRLAWNPLIFENFNKPNFKNETQKISKLVGILAFGGTIGVTLLAPEITDIVGTPEYAGSAILIGFLTLTGIIEILKRLRGFGPLIQKKTSILTLAEAVGIIIAVILLILLRDLELLGIGIAFLVPAVVKYFILTINTSKTMGINFKNWNEPLLLFLVLLALGFVFFNFSMIIRMSFLIAVTIFCLYLLKNLYTEVRRE